MSDRYELNNEELNTVAGGAGFEQWAGYIECLDRAGNTLASRQPVSTRSNEAEAFADITQVAEDYKRTYFLEWNKILYWYFRFENGYALGFTEKKEFRFY